MLRLSRIILLSAGLVSASLFSLPKSAKADITVPTTDCDKVLTTANDIGFFITNSAVKESGSLGFTYGSQSNSFVSVLDSTLTFSFDLLFDDPSKASVKLDFIDMDCNSIAGTTGGSNPQRSNVITYNLSTSKMVLNNLEATSQIVPLLGKLRYVILEVVDGLPATINTYSYIVDIENIKNPTGLGGSIEPQGKRPVIIIPGIMGTEMFKGDEKLWPNVSRMLTTNNDRFMDRLSYNSEGQPIDISVVSKKVLQKELNYNYTEKLIIDFKQQGYVENLNLFTFPYDWRKDLNDVAKNELKNYIDEKLIQTGFKKLDILAHSQGGLIIKSLLFKQPEYKSKIDTLVFVGTPHLGAPKAAKGLLYGDAMGIELLGLGLDPGEVKRISHNMPSVYELLPSKEYLSQGQNYLASAKFLGPLIKSYSYLNYDESKQYLIDLGLNENLMNRAQNFHSQEFDNYNVSDVKTFNIVGCQEATIGSILSKQNKYRLTYTAGDGTVPLISARNLFGADTYFAKESNHGTMLTDEGTRQLIVNIISGSSLSTENIITQDPSQCYFSGQEVSVRSPIELNIFDEQGRHVGPSNNGNIEVGIPNAQYDILGEDKFAFLPAGRNYRIELKTKDKRKFDFYSQIISESKVENTEFYENITISGGSTVLMYLDTANKQQIKLDINGDGYIDEELNPISNNGF